MSLAPPEELLVFVPLGLLLIGAIKASRHRIQDPRFLRQCWTYGDVIFVFALLTATGHLPLIPILAEQPVIVIRAVTSLFQATAVLGAVYSILKLRYALPFWALGFRSPSDRYLVAWALKIICAILSVVGVSALLLMLLAGIPPAALIGVPGDPLPGSTLERLFHQPQHIVFFTVLWVLDGVLIIPIMEEVLFRGFAFAPLLGRFGQRGAMFVSAALRGVGHLYSPRRALFSFLLGLIYWRIYRRTGSLIPSLAFHVAGNAFVFGTHLLEGLRDAHQLILPGTIAALVLFLGLRHTHSQERSGLRGGPSPLV